MESGNSICTVLPIPDAASVALVAAGGKRVEVAVLGAGEEDRQGLGRGCGLGLGAWVSPTLRLT